MGAGSVATRGVVDSGVREVAPAVVGIVVSTSDEVAGAAEIGMIVRAATGTIMTRTVVIIGVGAAAETMTRMRTIRDTATTRAAAAITRTIRWP